MWHWLTLLDVALFDVTLLGMGHTHTHKLYTHTHTRTHCLVDVALVDTA
jgi:hypothetical protein